MTKILIKNAQSVAMDHQPEPYFGFVDGASRWFQSLVAATWVIYHPNRSPLCTNGVCIGSTTKNQAEYDIVIGLMCDALNQGIRHIHIYLDSQLVVSHLNQTFEIKYSHLFRKYLHAKRLSRQFDYITFTHVPRSQNQTFDRIANNIPKKNASRINHHTLKKKKKHIYPLA